MIFRTVLALALGTAPAAAAAQYIGGRAPAPPPAPAAGTVETPEAALARNVRLLAINPRNYEALLGAGRAALGLGDAQAAIGFFGRAEEVNSNHWAPKAGQGSALAHMGEATAALGLFEQAQQLGAVRTLVALDRGLALDLLGRQAEAQEDYRAIPAGPDHGEAQRRLALSLAIAGRKAEALAILDPLIARRDNGARRTRAFILALGGDVEGARAAIAALMPSGASGFDPFLRRLAALNAGQKAAAVHLGMMPAEGAALAAAEAEPAPVRIASIRPRPVAPKPNPTRLAEIESTLVRLPQSSDASSPAPAPRLAERAAVPPASRRITDQLAPPPAPRPIVERTPARRTVAPERTLASRPASDERASGTSRSSAAAASVRRPAEQARPAARSSEERGSGSSRVYVQLAGGSNAERMGREYERIRSGRPALFRGRQPLVSEVRGWSRLLVGPFKDQAQAQEFVNDLHAAKLEGFVWTAPAGTRFDKPAGR